MADAAIVAARGLRCVQLIKGFAMDGASMTSSPTPPPRRSRFALRYSFCMLLAAVTTFAIGFPIWYRWPYEQVTEQSATPPYKKIQSSTTWQRQWGGGKKKHGMRRVVWDGVTARVETYENDKLQGPYKSFYLMGPLAEEGQYADDQRDGVWTYYQEDGVVKATLTFQRGVLNGPASISGRSGRHQLQFAAGRLTAVNGRPVKDRLSALVEAGHIDSPAIVAALRTVTGAEYIDTPIRYVAENLSQNLRVPIIIDRVHVDPDLRVSFSGHSLDLSSSLTVMATKYGLGCDYRYGSLWITSAGHVQYRRDPTGVANIAPPKDSPLAAAWNEPVNVVAAWQPLASTLNQIAEPRGIVVDVSRIATDRSNDPAYPVTVTLWGQSFRDAVGILLNQARCRCRLEGETLVILPPD